MQPSWLGWLGFIVLAAMISVTAWQAWAEDTVPFAVEAPQ